MLYTPPESGMKGLEGIHEGPNSLLSFLIEKAGNCLNAPRLQHSEDGTPQK